GSLVTVEEVQSFSNFKLAKVLKLIRQLTQSVIEPLGDFFSIPFFRSSFLFFFFSSFLSCTFPGVYLLVLSQF
ncbi:hypothetical protein, partial [Providencia sp. PROV210]|uniref:hypothetical protein n=1 Tax=Providencia sp. PROV210 TaxID=2949907 RepID=UPI00234AA376